MKSVAHALACAKNPFKKKARDRAVAPRAIFSHKLKHVLHSKDCAKLYLTSSHTSLTDLFLNMTAKPLRHQSNHTRM
jgi:hypothetical protein